MLNERPNNEPEPRSQNNDAPEASHDEAVADGSYGHEEMNGARSYPVSPIPPRPANAPSQPETGYETSGPTSPQTPWRREPYERPTLTEAPAPGISGPSAQSGPASPRLSPAAEANRPYTSPYDQSYTAVGATERDEAMSPAARPATEVEKKPETPAGLLDMVEGESIVQEVDSGDDGRFILTSHRLIYHGKSFDNSLFSSAAIGDITSVELSRRPRDSRSAWWGLAGAIASLAVWQVTTNETVGIVAGAAVGAIAALLLADFWFRPPGLVLRFTTAGGGVSGPVSGKRAQDAERLAATLQRLRYGAGDMRPSSRSGHRLPPGGSPGLT